MTSKLNHTKVTHTELIHHLAKRLEAINKPAFKLMSGGTHLVLPPQAKTWKESAKDLLEAFVASCGDMLSGTGSVRVPSLIIIAIHHETLAIRCKLAKQLCRICNEQDYTLGKKIVPPWLAESVSERLGVSRPYARAMILELRLFIQRAAGSRLEVSIPGMGTFSPTLIKERTIKCALKGIEGPMVMPEHYDYRLKPFRSFKEKYGWITKV